MGSQGICQKYFAKATVSSADLVKKRTNEGEQSREKQTYIMEGKERKRKWFSLVMLTI